MPDEEKEGLKMDSDENFDDDVVDDDAPIGAIDIPMFDNGELIKSLEELHNAKIKKTSV